MLGFHLHRHLAVQHRGIRNRRKDNQRDETVAGRLSWCHRSTHTHTHTHTHTCSCVVEKVEVGGRAGTLRLGTERQTSGRRASRLSGMAASLWQRCSSPQKYQWMASTPPVQLFISAVLYYRRRVCVCVGFISKETVCVVFLAISCVFLLMN